MQPLSTPSRLWGLLAGLAAIVAFGLAPAASAQGDLVITGVIDADLSGGLPKAVELYAINDVPDLSVYSVGVANNGGGSDGPEQALSGSLAAGSFYYLADDGTATNPGDQRFMEFFGFAADLYGNFGVNGDDAVELFYDASGAFGGSETVVDTFGDPDVNGDDEAWDYTDGWAYRVDGTGPDGGTFEVDDFTYSGRSGLEDETTNASASTPFPIGSYSAGMTGSGALVVTTAEDELNMDGDCSLREAVQAANTDAVVDMCDGTSGETITFASAYTITLSLGELLITDGVTIDASSVGSATVDGDDASRVFDVDASGQTVFFTSLVIQNGNAGVNSSAPNVGGGVDLKAGSDATFTDVDVTDSVAGINGGGIHGAGDTDIVITTSADGSSTIARNVAQGNDAGMGGGGVWGAGTVDISGNVTIDANAATGTAGSGGGVFNFGGVLTISDATISNNTANRAGGGVEDFGDDDDDVDVMLTDVTLSGNSIATAAPGNGGGLHSGGGEVVVTGGMVTGNTAVEGGGLWTSGSLTATGTRVWGNNATGDADEPFEGGAGLFNQGGTMTLSELSVLNNVATGPGASGGGLFVNGGTVTVDASSFAGNTSLRAGGGIEVNGGTVELTDTDFDENETGDAPGNGGALHVTRGTVNATGGTVSGNTAASEGGGFWNNAGWTMTVTGTSFTGNTASGDAADNGGGGLFNNGGTLVLNSVTVTENQADGAAGSGGGVFNGPGGDLTVNGGTIQSNSANRAGGGIENASGMDAPAVATLNDVVLDQNGIAVAAPGNGGGLHSGGGTVTVNGGRITSNVATEGGGLWSNGTLVVQPGEEPTTIWNNTGTGDAADNGGGGVYAESGADVTISGAFIDGNKATGASGSGGGILVADDATVRVTGGRIAENEANRAGAGIEIADDAATEGAFGEAYLTEVMVTDNVIVTAAPGNGGGLHIGGRAYALVQRSTFANNFATEGGGLWVSGGGTLGMNNSTVSNNAATGEGGGLYLVGGGTIGLDALTVAENTAGVSGGGLGRGIGEAGFFGFTNTILADNSAPAGPDCFGSYQASFSLVEDTSGCMLNGDNNLTGQDAMLAPLADNGGPTLTRALPATSPAVDAGETQFAIDQRGFVRNVGQDDIGAYEFGAAPGGDGVLACSMDRVLAFGDFDTDGDDATYGEFAEVMNNDGSTVDLSSCSFATFDPQTERVVYTTRGMGTVDAGASYAFASLNGDQMIPAGSIPDGPGAIVLLEGTTTVGASVADVLDQVVAAVVYADEDDVFASMSGGGTAQQRADQKAAFAAALARLGQPVAGENGAGEVDLAVTAAPNPLRDRTTVTFGVGEAADVRVAVYDALGREVALLADAPFAVGRHELALNARDLPAGVYVVRATVGAETFSTRVTVAR